MSKESLDYSILCPNYYTSWEEGCCMENCTHNDLDLCPIHYVKGLLEDKDQRIADLEEQLSNAIIPKFKIGQEVWYISLTNYICNFIIEDLQFTLCGDGRSGICYFGKDNEEEHEWNLFATEEEAQAKLEELKNE